MKMITTNQCENCTHCEMRKTDKTVKVYCANKNKEFFYGQKISCEDKKLRSESK